MINISNLNSLYANLSKSLTELMLFHFDLSWRAIKWYCVFLANDILPQFSLIFLRFPYFFVAGTLASGIHIRLEIELN